LHAVFSKDLFVSGASLIYESVECIQVILNSLIGTVGKEVMNSQPDNIVPKKIAHNSIPSLVTRVMAAIAGWDI
jgi:hypothetical protein